jgi:hypothetical protein
LAAPAQARPRPGDRPLVGRHDAKIVRLKVREDANIRLTGAVFTGADAGPINAVLKGGGVRGAGHLFPAERGTLERRSDEVRKGGHPVADLSTFFRVRLDGREDSAALASRLKELAIVEDAYPEPSAAPPSASLSLVSAQGYRNAAPTGTGSAAAATWPGATGGSVRVFDVEYSWNTAHEDLGKARVAGTRINVGTPQDPFSDNNHGTAVLGEISGTSNSVGVTGAAPAAALGLVNAYSAEGGWDVGSAVYVAANAAAKGDVILVEQQMWGPSNEFLPVEWLPDVYESVRYAIGRGVIVVEAAANGGVNLSDPAYGSKFPQGKADSGAIIVGAGAACSGGTPRTALNFSNYGIRVNLQGWGECVTTTGYGDPYGGGTNSLYTSSFSGTSSASSIVAAAAAAYSSAYEKLNGVAPTPVKVRSDLMGTGTAQPSTDARKIGAQPNLAKALLRTDRKPPTAPTRLTVALNTANKPVLRWTAASDNVGVTNYRIYRGTTPLATIAPATTWTHTTALARTSYSYKAVAVDQAGRASAASNTVTITTR